MRKRSVILLLALLCTVCVAGCAKKEEKKLDTLVGTSAKKELPAGVPVVEKPEDFQKTTSDWSYHAQTDGNLDMLAYSETEDENCIYQLKNDIIHVLDKQTGNYTPLCNKPDCDHGTKSGLSREDCNGYTDMYPICYYDGYVYTVLREDNSEGEDIWLYRISTKGEGREKVCMLASISNDEVVSLDGSESVAQDIEFTIYRGYIYYAYRIGTSGLKDETLHNNNSSYVIRMNLKDEKDKEYLMPLEGDTLEQISFWASEGYVYFVDIEMEDNDRGYLYRYNIDADQVEKLPIGKTEVGGYAPAGQKVYYIKQEESWKLFCYDSEKDTTETVCDFSVLDERYGKFYGVNLGMDKDYIYAYATVDQEKGITNCMVLDYSGKKLTDFDFEVNGDYRVQVRIALDRILLCSEGTWYFFSKEEMLSGNPQPKKIEGSGYETEK